MYKTVLVHIDATAGAVQRTMAAARLALAHDACLVGAAPTGLSHNVFPVGGFVPGLPTVTFPIEPLRAQAERALDAFEATARQAGVSKFERLRIDEEAGIGIGMQARYADLVVISQSLPDQASPGPRADFPEYVLLHCARPVLVLPANAVAGELGRRVLVAWNGSAEAVRAITSAITLLKAAAHVGLAVFNAAATGSLEQAEPGAAMARYLERHGVKPTLVAAHTSQEPGEALLTYAVDNGFDLIVMGAYGHARLRQILVGGATRTVLRASPLPLWMAH